MKVLLIILSLVFIACEGEANKVSNVDAKADMVKTKAASTDVIDGLPEDEEDCDDKFEKTKEEEKKVDENNLFGQNSEENEGDEGCTIE